MTYLIDAWLDRPHPYLRILHRETGEVCAVLEEEALNELDKHRAIFTKGGVMSDAMIDAYIDIKRAEARKVAVAVHPLEFELYYSV